MREKMMTIKPIATQSMHKKQMYKSERRSRGFLFELNPVGEIDEKRNNSQEGLRKQIKDQISRIKTNKRKKLNVGDGGGLTKMEMING